MYFFTNKCYSTSLIIKVIIGLMGLHCEIYDRTLATSYEERSIDVVIVRQPGEINKPVIWIGRETY